MGTDTKARLGHIDLTDASVWEQAAPHEWLDQLRAEDPVHWHAEYDGPGFWALTSHEHVRRVSTSPGEFSSYVGGPLRLDPTPESLDSVRMVIIGMDPPEHRDFRTIVSKAFTPKMIAQLGESMEASVEIFGYASEMAARERAIPSGTLTGALLAAEVDGRKLTDMEFTLFFLFLIVAGNETTRTASSHGLLTLLDHPGALDRLVRDPSLMPGAVEEIVRWEPPIHHFRRTATTDVRLGDTTIAEGDKVLMWYAGSNRDPQVFDDPHSFLIDRSPNPQLSFGIGEHFCLGANLARLSLRLLFTELLGTVENIRLDTPPRRLHSNLINGIKELRTSYDVR